MPAARLYTPAPVNLRHPLNRGKAAWWLNLPGLDATSRAWDLMGRYHATHANIYSGSPNFANYSTCRPSPWSLGTGYQFYNSTLDCGVCPGLEFTTGDYTVACWLMSSDQSGHAACYYSRGGYNSGGVYMFVGTGGVLQSTVTNGGTHDAASSTAVMSDGVWAHVVWVKSGSAVRWYVNGEDRTSGSPTTAGAGAVGTSRTTMWGTYQENQGAYALHGGLYDLQVWQRGLPVGEVAEVYRQSARGYPPGADSPLSWVSSRRYFLPASPPPPPAVDPLESVHMPGFGW